MHRTLRNWVICSTALGALLAVAGWRLRAGTSGSEREELRLTLAGGLGLLLAALAAALARRPLGRWLEAEGDGPGIAAARPYATVFAASFVCLFLEVMLIRYAGSQVRVFSFYKNIPLISCYLGMGLGCFLRRGRSRDALAFLLWLLPAAVALSAGSAAASRTLGRWAAAGSSEHILGDVVLRDVGAGQALASQLLMGGFAVAALVAITLLFVPLGRLLGEALEGVPRLAGYSVNVLGSLLGVAVFVAASRAWAPPWTWFVIGTLPLLWWVEGRGARLLALGLVAASALAAAPGSGETIWSSYQKLIGRERTSASGQKSYLVEISDVFYQVAVDLRPEAVKAAGRNPFPHYDAQFTGLPRNGRVAVVGAGTGNDVAAALRAGAGQVDAVDIDPAIVGLGRRHHPERPYDDPRVRVIVDDARAAFRELPPASYDAVVFGLLDSHTQLGISSVRLDNYVFTLESFADARRLLAPGGRLIVTAATFREWFAQRLVGMLAVTCGAKVATSRSGVWVTYACVPAPAPAPAAQALRESETLPSDDWPFLYLPEAVVPFGYLVVIAMLALASALVLWLKGLPLGRLDAAHWQLFFLGAAFLLVEVHAINGLALLYGSTWLVSAATIALVLVLILLANLAVAKLPALPPGLAYAGLFASLAASYFANAAPQPGQGAAQAAGLALLQVLPVLFAGLIFARAFRASADPGTAIGANMLGAVLGGWAEYSSMAIGIRALVLVAAALYLGSLLAMLRAKAGTAAASG